MKNNPGTLFVRIPNELKHRIELLADEQGVSLNQFVLYVFTKEVVEAETKNFFKKERNGKSKKVILSEFDAVMKKVGKRKLPTLDKYSG